MTKKYLKQIGIICLAVFAVTVSFFAGLYVDAQKASVENSVSSVINKNLGKPDDVDFSEFWDAWNILDQKFVETKSVATSSGDFKESDPTKKRVYGAISGMVDSLGDPYTSFFTPSETEIFETELSGSLEGIGVEVGVKDGVITAITPLKGSPAEKAGVMAGDKIIKINDTLTLNMSLNEAVSLIRGKSGTTVNLTLIREGKNDPITVSVVRDRINIPVVTTENLVKDKIFVIKLYSFSSNSPQLFRNALRDFIETGYRKLIIDLRNNSGGYLEASVDMASWFLPAGKVIVTEDFGKNKEPDVYKSYGYDIFTNQLKLVVLVNNGSASASEILAAALNEHGKAILVGEKTFGKGSVQELVSMNNGAALKVTIAEWLTPLGKSISVQGLMPQHEIKNTDEDVRKGNDPQMNKAVEVLRGM